MQENSETGNDMLYTCDAPNVQTMCFLLSPIICLRLDTCLPVPTFLFPSLPADYLCANAMITTWFVSLSTIIAGIGVQN